jgi:hypothetical protein
MARARGRAAQVDIDGVEIKLSRRPIGDGSCHEVLNFYRGNFRGNFQCLGATGCGIASGLPAGVSPGRR